MFLFGLLEFRENLEKNLYCQRSQGGGWGKNAGGDIEIAELLDYSDSYL
jgi:hypothetical protein